VETIKTWSQPAFDWANRSRYFSPVPVL